MWSQRPRREAGDRNPGVIWVPGMMLGAGFRRSRSIVKNIILWPIAFCGPFSVSEDFVLTITTFSSQGSFMKLFIFWMTGHI